MDRFVERTHRSLLCWTFLSSFGILGCLDKMTEETPRVLSISPKRLKPDITARLTGIRLPKAPAVEIDGNAATVINSSQREIWFKTPLRMRSGHRLLFIRSENVTIRYPVEIIGSTSTVPEAPPPNLSDATVLTTDAGSTSPGASARLSARFTADPMTSDAIRIELVEARANEITLQLIMPPNDVLRASAFHITFDKNLVRYRVARPSNGTDIFKAELIADNRLAIGWIFRDNAMPTARLTFDLIGVGEARLEFPTLHRSARDEFNQPLRAIMWRAGSIRVSESTP